MRCGIVFTIKYSSNWYINESTLTPHLLSSGQESGILTKQTMISNKINFLPVIQKHFSAHIFACNAVVLSVATNNAVPHPYITILELCWICDYVTWHISEIIPSVCYCTQKDFHTRQKWRHFSFVLCFYNNFSSSSWQVLAFSTPHFLYIQDNRNITHCWVSQYSWLLLLKFVLLQNLSVCI